MSDQLTLTVNGAKQTISTDPDTPLFFVLRNELKLTGPSWAAGWRNVDRARCCWMVKRFVPALRRFPTQ